MVVGSPTRLCASECASAAASDAPSPSSTRRDDDDTRFEAWHRVGEQHTQANRRMSCCSPASCSSCFRLVASCSGSNAIRSISVAAIAAAASNGTSAHRRSCHSRNTSVCSAAAAAAVPHGDHRVGCRSQRHLQQQGRRRRSWRRGSRLARCTAGGLNRRHIDDVAAWARRRRPATRRIASPAAIRSSSCFHRSAQPPHHQPPVFARSNRHQIR